jgi:hypothetical protein
MLFFPGLTKMQQRPDRGHPAPMADAYLPQYHFHERHSIDNIQATPETIISAVAAFDDEADPLLNTLLNLREWPARQLSKFGIITNNLGQDRFGLDNFFLLDRSDHAIAFGLVGRFWRPDFGLIDIQSEQEFLQQGDARAAKLVLSFEVQAQSDARSSLTTETRIHCPDKLSRCLCAGYWAAIYPFSGWIRRRILEQIKQEAQTAQAH